MRNGLDKDTVEALLAKANEHLRAMREGEGWTSKRFDFSEANDDLLDAGGWNTAYHTAGLRLVILFVAGVLGAVSSMRWADLVTDAETDNSERKRKLSELDNQIRSRLLTQGFVQEVGKEYTGRRGKPPTLYSLTRKGAAIVATALGGSPTDALRALADANNSELADRLVDLYSRSVPSGAEPDFGGMKWTIEAGSNDGKLLSGGIEG